MTPARKAAMLLGLLVVTASAVHGAIPEDYYTIGELDVGWGEAIPDAAWKDFNSIPIVKCVFGKEHARRQIDGAFRCAWQAQGIILRVDTRDAEYLPPTSQNKVSIAQPYTYDILEFWLNSAQFAVYDLDGTPTVAGYPLEAWKSEQSKAILAEIKAYTFHHGDKHGYLVFVPWKAFREGPETDAVPARDTLYMAVGIDDKDPDGHAQFFSPMTYSFGKTTTYAACILSQEGSGTSADWEASVGCQPTCLLDYDLEGFICLHVKCDEKSLEQYPGRKAEILIRSISDPAREVRISVENFERGYTRLPQERLLPTLEMNICDLSGYAEINGWRLPLVPQGRLIPMRNGMSSYTMQEPPPSDFKEFWETLAKDALAVPLKPEISEFRRNPNGSIVYRIVLNGADGIPSVGFLTLPKDTSKRHPCLISGNGYGGKNEPSDRTEQGLATFTHNARGQGHSLALHDFKEYLITLGAPDRDKYYYKQAYMDFLRAIEFVASHPQIDPERIGLVGGSQGGAAAIVGAALDKRVKLMSVIDPGFCGWELCCDMYEEGHYGSFLRLTKEKNGPSRKEVMEFLKYYDMAYLCSWITCPTIFVNDYLCFPEGKAAAYNNIPAQDKCLFSYPEGPHCFVDEKYNAKFQEWLKKYLVSPAHAP